MCTHGDGLRLNGFQDRHRPAGRAWGGDLKPAPPPPSCPENWPPGVWLLALSASPGDAA